MYTLSRSKKNSRFFRFDSPIKKWRDINNLLYVQHDDEVEHFGCKNLFRFVSSQFNRKKTRNIFAVYILNKNYKIL